jgi:hypothetical protein
VSGPYSSSTGWVSRCVFRLSTRSHRRPTGRGFRPFRWVNVFSRRDPISGRLTSYDDSRQPLYRKRRVRNLPDRAAVLPLLAHLEYFSNPVVIRQLVRALR